MTKLERILLGLIQTGRGRWSGHNLETRLSQMDVPHDPDAMAVLKGLEAREMVKRHSTLGIDRLFV
jgi:hypothetical protein